MSSPRTRGCSGVLHRRVGGPDVLPAHAGPGPEAVLTARYLELAESSHTGEVVLGLVLIGSLPSLPARHAQRRPTVSA
ncbi:hypothetical protein [Actinoalloteichus fjordicus]|uniref:hypothetical protein n=1 Tax=Actinoalloteichus fjordicus TaxID=1612552 RepID=UPI0012FB3235|nr:hypothetical protein [Actinoalloteichus fjordicus]